MKRIQRVFGDVDALRYVDDRLDEERRAAFQLHLAGDPDLSSRVQLWTRQNEAIRQAYAGVQAEPVPLWLRLDQLTPDVDRSGLASSGPRLAQATARVAAPAPVRVASPRRSRSRTMAAALVVVLLGGLAIAVAWSVLPLSMGSGEAERAMVADAAVARGADAFRAYALDPTHPVELSAVDQPALEAWLGQRVGLPVHAPDLRTTGWTFLGGRITPGETGPAAFLLYDNGAGRRLGLTVARATVTGSSDATTGILPGGNSTLSWTSGALSYVVVAARDEGWMNWNAAELRTRVDAAAR